MTKQPKSPNKRKAKTLRTRATTRGRSMRAKTASQTPKRDPLDDLVDAAARALALKIEPAWTGAIKANLATTFALAALFAEFPLPDEAEPAPIFSA
jgi:1-carboxybiuret hydrolase subunit AtzG-like